MNQRSWIIYRSVAGCSRLPQSLGLRQPRSGPGSPEKIKARSEFIHSGSSMVKKWVHHLSKRYKPLSAEHSSCQPSVGGHAPTLTGGVQAGAYIHVKTLRKTRPSVTITCLQGAARVWPYGREDQWQHNSQPSPSPQRKDQG